MPFHPILSASFSPSHAHSSVNSCTHYVSKQGKKGKKNKPPKKEKPQWGDGTSDRAKKKAERAAATAAAKATKEKYVNVTPKGEKKILGDFATEFEPEASLSLWWAGREGGEERGAEDGGTGGGGATLVQLWEGRSE